MWYPDVPLSEVVIDGYEKQTNGNFSIPVTSTESLPFGDIELVRGMYLETDIACKIRLNGSLDAISMSPAEAGTPAKLFLEGEINQVDVENEDASTILTGVYVFWGDPTP
jgi:hypothetical protein